MLKILIIACLLLLSSFSFWICAQELSGIKDNEPVVLNGGVSVNSVFYQSLDTMQRRDPFTWVFTGNLNLNIYEIIECPVSFTYSNYSENFSHPFNFNQFGIQPSYKGLKAYMGYNSMSFSGYSLSGHQFWGLGLELKPKMSPWHFSVMYGRFLKGVEEDTLDEANIPAFGRYGYAIKIGYVQKGNEIHFVLFRAWDQINSLSILPQISDIKPQENLVLSILARKRISKRLSINVELASSAMTLDSRMEESRMGENIFRTTGFLMRNLQSTAYYNAFKSNIKYSGNSYGFGTSYERIEPGYITLGAYYFNNDFENLTLDVSKRLLKNKINISGRIGLQRNNLDSDKVSESKKTVGNLNVSYAVNPKLNINTTFSNFVSYTHIRSDFENINQLNPYENLDTLDFTQISQNIGTNISWRMGNIQSKDKQQALNLNMSMQQASIEQEEEKKPGARFYNGNVAYNLNLIDLNLTLFSSINTNYSELPEVDNQLTFGPTTGCSKSMLEKKLRISSSLSYNTNFETENFNNIVVWRNTGSYTLLKQHSFNLSLVTLNRNAAGQEPLTEFTLTFGYRYNFKASYNEFFK